MQGDFAEVGTADFGEICVLVSVAGEARAKVNTSFGSSSGPCCCFETKANGTAPGPIVVTKRQAAFNTAAKRVQLSLSLDLFYP